jgi:hypothetical protein
MGERTYETSRFRRQVRNDNFETARLSFLASIALAPSVVSVAFVPFTVNTSPLFRQYLRSAAIPNFLNNPL